mmetsp:Transcript_722/g.1264  ORF Transcript_722/g.1264 Transcript_722/m.1264 type:complete len:235 (+) Transcript_722:2038-2742(+)
MTVLSFGLSGTDNLAFFISSTTSSFSSMPRAVREAMSSASTCEDSRCFKSLKYVLLFAMPSSAVTVAATVIGFVPVIWTLTISAVQPMSLAIALSMANFASSELSKPDILMCFKVKTCETLAEYFFSWSTAFLKAFSQRSSSFDPLAGPHLPAFSSSKQQYCQSSATQGLPKQKPLEKNLLPLLHCHFSCHIVHGSPASRQHRSPSFARVHSLVLQVWRIASSPSSIFALGTQP